MDVNMISIGKRIKERRKELKLTQNDIDQRCGIASGALSQIENGTRTPSAITLYKLSQVLKCNIEWLITGDSTNSKNQELSEKEKELFNCFRKLPKDEQDEILAIINIKVQKFQKISNTMDESSLLTNSNINNMVV